MSVAHIQMHSKIIIEANIMKQDQTGAGWYGSSVCNVGWQKSEADESWRQLMWMAGKGLIKYEQVHEISNNVVCATSKAPDQPGHTRSLIRAFASRYCILWLLSYWLNSIWSF